jgi:hypothetical protein
MSRDVFWQPTAAAANLACGSMQAAINPLSPASGLAHGSYGGVSLEPSTFLGVEIAVDHPAGLTECYQRGGDFIARYAQTDERPFAVLLYWQAGLLDFGGVAYPHVDLIVSVETSLLDSRPLLAATSRLDAAIDETICGDGFLLARFGNAALSYAEMCHPDDAIAASVETSGDRFAWKTWLFGQPLEKGVILRSRLRGLFVPRANDERIARRALAEFAASAPPLTT